MPWEKSPESLVERFDRLVPGDGPVERKKMFGYPSAVVNGYMFAGLFQSSMVLRLPPDLQAEFLRIPGATQFSPMADRPMVNFVVVPPDMLADEAALSPWIDRALREALALPAKIARPRATKPRRAS